MPSTRIGRRGQITVPKAVRQSMGLAVGDHVAFVERGGDVVLRPVRQSLRDLRGSVPVDGPQDFDAVRDAARRARSERLTQDVGSANTGDETDAD
ncbi:AbrB/MazE/SpoVT family DNA-binding domain-containing protein [Rubrivirga litoralis]|uniref:AbrB/MazE/SpoVT family DNA-binding domain-containing protein n=1 Tax=Rubrivirga litoralis TaxID=3075598 RepID=A0ABU3BRQ0_9BACT|nr:AbrB/MazE/SpoVT family DNA-binding domain-containing protein [Rubrivirga sp. F394]MDT0631972.1 AbrB/MazE/SpoVT family DNA-binding domain-containing protein [Rubrivirga sp. F394]